ncbi:hypothetical protein OBBRIDRAFT_285660 [Obba rivulosa]|uniref:DUF6534 domain-containing protein n=1 Tax=Obba rivulosa TaxID=1052685 RepID=A0A8E2DHD9_9APHY|nr:hypothetical protein OBBRIDRAFT_285660 [Obba rivulosa]
MSAVGMTPHELNQTFGVLLIGFVFAVTIYGLTFFQAYMYYSRFPADSFFTRATISVLWAVDTATTTLLSHTTYYYLITSFMASFSELDMTRTFVAEYALATFAISLVQLFYASRIWKVNPKSPVLPAIVATLASAALVLGLVAAVKISEQAWFAHFITPGLRIVIAIQDALFIANDLLIVSTLCYLLQPERNPGMKVPKDKFQTFVVYTFNRGICFTFAHIVTLVIFAAMPYNQTWEQVWVLFHFSLSKVYINSLLSMLNFRNSFRGRGVDEEESLNQHHTKTTGSITASIAPSGGAPTRPGLQFNTASANKQAHPMTIELDTVRSRNEFDDSAHIDGGDGESHVVRIRVG